MKKLDADDDDDDDDASLMPACQGPQYQN